MSLNNEYEFLIDAVEAEMLPAHDCAPTLVLRRLGKKDLVSCDTCFRDAKEGELLLCIDPDLESDAIIYMCMPCIRWAHVTADRVENGVQNGVSR